jgi:3,4-dihydroxy 2-butanone 4-phosphate synthase / GTP cyclohydrolase II
MSTLGQATSRFADRELVLVGDEGGETVFLACAADGIDASRLGRLHALGRGMVVLGLPEEVAGRLALPVPWNATSTRREVALTAPIDAAAGITGGWSLRDRALTMRVASDPGSGSNDLTIPGHVYPALIEEQPGNAAAAAVELARLSDRAPAVALSAVVDDHGRPATLRDIRADEQLGRLHVASSAELHSGLIARLAAERSVSCALPTRDGMFRAVGYAASEGRPATVALVHGDPSLRPLSLVHVHIACLFGDAFGSLLCDCGRALDRAANAIARAGAGVIVYARTEWPTPGVCARDQPIDAALVAGVLRAAGVRALRLIEGGRGGRLGEQLRTCGLEVAG